MDNGGGENKTHLGKEGVRGRGHSKQRNEEGERVFPAKRENDQKDKERG